MKMKILTVLGAAFVALVSNGADERSPFGVCNGFLYQGFDEEKSLTCEQKRYLATNGIAWVRADLRPAWQQSRIVNGARIWNFDHALAQYDQLRSFGLNALCLLNTTPRWMNPIHEHLDEWTNFVVQAALAIKGRTRYFEIWNEENFAFTNIWGSADKIEHARNYTTCLNAAYRAIKAVRPDAIVVFGGTTGVPIDFIGNCMDSGALFDVMNVHPYSQSFLPEDELPSQLSRLRKLMRERGRAETPIWATEIGWSSSPQYPTSFLKDALPRAFQALGMDTRKLPLAMVKGISSDVRNLPERLPPFASYHFVDTTKIDELDVKAFPVLLLIANEWGFPHTRRAILDYVRRGGVVVLPEAFVFNAFNTLSDEQGDPLPGSRDKIDLRQELHLSIPAFWTSPVTTTSNVTFSLEGPLVVTNYGHRFTHYVTGDALKDGETFTPVCWGVDGERRYPVAGAYRLAGGGGIVVASSPAGATPAEISPEVQGLILPRAYLISLVNGIEKVFWYCAYSGAEGRKYSNVECNYGIAEIFKPDHPENQTGRKIIRDKPAMRSYRTLAALLPPEAKVSLREEDGVYRTEWLRRNGEQTERILAVWRPYGRSTFTPKARPLRACDVYGRPLEIADSYSVGPAIVYLAFKER